MSKATLISIVPFPIAEFKPGIYPGFFEIGASNREIPELLVISDSVYHVEIDENRTITVKCPSEDIARSVVDDYIVSNLAFSVEEDSSPGFFWKPGAHDLVSVMANFAKDLEYQKGRQIRWFKKLVATADDDWEKSRQHKFISDVQRYAAKYLKLTKPWIISSTQEQGFIKCIACQSSVDAHAIICPNCRCILNMEKYKTLQFATEVK
jgi:hypothetical protein